MNSTWMVALICHAMTLCDVRVAVCVRVRGSRDLAGLLGRNLFVHRLHRLCMPPWPPLAAWC